MVAAFFVKGHVLGITVQDDLVTSGLESQLGQFVDEQSPEVFPLVALRDGDVLDVAAQAALMDQFLLDDQVPRRGNVARGVLHDYMRVVLSRGRAIEVHRVPMVDDLFEPGPRKVPDNG